MRAEEKGDADKEEDVAHGQQGAVEEEDESEDEEEGAAAAEAHTDLYCKRHMLAARHRLGLWVEVVLCESDSHKVGMLVDFFGEFSRIPGRVELTVDRYRSFGV